MLMPWIITIKLPILNLLLMRHLALDPLWVSQMSIQIIDMSDLEDTLIILSFDTNTTSLKIWLFFKEISTLLEVIWELVYLDKYRMPMIFRYDLDCSNLGDFTWSASMQIILLTYFSIAWRSEGLAILLVAITILLASAWIKSAITFDLILLKALLMLTTCKLEFLMKLLVLLIFIGMMTYFHDGPLVVMLILGFGLSLPLIIFWTISIFLFWRFGKAFLIFKVPLAMLKELDELDDTWAYDFLLLVEFFLKYFDILLTSLTVLAEMGGGRDNT